MANMVEVGESEKRRIRKAFKGAKAWFYAYHGGRGGNAELFNDEVWLPLAQQFNMPVRQIKNIVQTKEYFGGGPNGV